MAHAKPPAVSRRAAVHQLGGDAARAGRQRSVYCLRRGRRPWGRRETVWRSRRHSPGAPSRVRRGCDAGHQTVADIIDRAGQAMMLPRGLARRQLTIRAPPAAPQGGAAGSVRSVAWRLVANPTFRPRDAAEPRRLCARRPNVRPTPVHNSFAGSARSRRWRRSTAPGARRCRP